MTSALKMTADSTAVSALWSHLDAVTFEVDEDWSDLDDGDRSQTVSFLPVALGDAEPRREFAHAERLHHVIVGPTVERRDLSVLGTICQQDDDRNVRYRPHRLADLETIHVWQAEV